MKESSCKLAKAGSELPTRARRTWGLQQVYFFLLERQVAENAITEHAPPCEHGRWSGMHRPCNCAKSGTMPLAECTAENGDGSRIGLGLSEGCTGALILS